MTSPAKPHGRDCPDRCSICLNADVHHVSQAGPDLLVDGVTARPIERPSDALQPRKRRRGKR